MKEVRLYHRFAIEVMDPPDSTSTNKNHDRGLGISSFPTDHVILSPRLYLGSPQLILFDTISFSQFPEKDYLDVYDIAEFLPDFLDEILKNKAYSGVKTIEPKLWYYPIDVNKYNHEEFESISRLVKDNTLSKQPVEKNPHITISTEEIDYYDGYTVTPINYQKAYTKTFFGINVKFVKVSKNGKNYLVLVPPDLGMGTPIFFHQVIKKYKLEEHEKELIEMYLDGLEIPTEILKLEKGENWIGKDVFVSLLYGKIIKILDNVHDTKINVD